MSKIRSYQAIVTKYLGPTNTKGSRIKAMCAAKSIFVHVNHALNIEENHAQAAEDLANKMGWGGDWFIGGMPDDTGYCFVCSQGLDTCTFTTVQRED